MYRLHSLFCALLLALAMALPAMAEGEARPDTPAEDLFYEIKVGDFYGVVDGTGEVLLEPKYKNIDSWPVLTEPFPVQMVDGTAAHFGRDGKPLYEARFEDVEPFAGKYAGAQKDGLWGVIDRQGNFVCDPKFQDVDLPTEWKGVDWKYFRTSEKKGKDWKHGLADLSGAVIMTNDYSINFHKSHYIEVDRDNYQLLLDDQGNTVGEGFQINLPYYGDKVSPDDAQLLWYEKLGRFFLITRDGRMKEVQGEHWRWGGKQLMAIKRNGKWGYMDRTGEMVIEPQFDKAEYFYAGYCSVSLGDKWGHIDTTGKVCGAYRWDEEYTIRKWGFGAVKKDGKEGIIDAAGNIMVEPMYKGIFMTGPTMYQYRTFDDQYGIRTFDGKDILPPSADYVFHDEQQGLIARTEDFSRWSILDMDGDVIHDAIFDNNPLIHPESEEYHQNGLFKSTVDGYFVLMDGDGKLVFDARDYDVIGFDQVEQKITDANTLSTNKEFNKAYEAYEAAIAFAETNNYPVGRAVNEAYMSELVAAYTESGNKDQLEKRLLQGAEYGEENGDKYEAYSAYDQLVILIAENNDSRLPEALKYAQKACELGSEQGCDNADVVRHNMQVLKNRKKGSSSRSSGGRGYVIIGIHSDALLLGPDFVSASATATNYATVNVDDNTVTVYTDKPCTVSISATFKQNGKYKTFHATIPINNSNLGDIMSMTINWDLDDVWVH